MGHQLSGRTMVVIGACATCIFISSKGSQIAAEYHSVMYVIFTQNAYLSTDLHMSFHKVIKVVANDLAT